MSPGRNASRVETPAVLARERPDVAQRLLERWAAEHYGAGSAIAGLEPMPGHAGISFGFEVEHADGRDALVIRVPPFGVRRQGSTDILRQVPLLQALEAEGVAVPSVRWFGEDPRWFGVPFLVVDRLEGFSIDRWVPTLRDGVDVALIEATFSRAMRELAAIHAVAWGERLTGWAPARSLVDEIEAWAPLLDKTDNPEWVRLGAELRRRLLATTPDEPEPGLFHGDYYSSNWVVDPTRGPGEGSTGDVLAGVVDWEIAGIGPSLLDVGWVCMLHDRSSWGPTPSAVLEHSPEPEVLAAQYERASGEPVAHLDWYRALAAWRLAAICMLNVRLHRTGQRHDPTWELLAESFEPMVSRARDLLGSGRAGSATDR